MDQMDGAQGPVMDVQVVHANLCILKLATQGMAEYPCKVKKELGVTNPADDTQALLKFTSKAFPMEKLDAQKHFKGLICITGGASHLGNALQDSSASASAQYPGQ
jgi:hypothetical protein